MTISSRDGNNICPVGYIALSMTIIAHGNDGTIRFQPDCMHIASRNSDNTCPIANIALAAVVVTSILCSNDSTVGF